MKQVLNALMVTFDFSQRGKSGTGLAAASLMSACRSHEKYHTSFVIEHLAITMPEQMKESLSHMEIFSRISNHTDLRRLDNLILACYVWSSNIINPLIALCREKGFNGKVILGGYQIHRKNCKELYPYGDIYIPGYGEASLPEAIMAEKSITAQIIEQPVNFEVLPSPFLDGSYDLKPNNEMLHWETSRGCQFKCNFCAHRDLISNGVHLMNFDKIKAELRLFKAFNVKKINVLDPVFNRGDRCKDILRYAASINLTSLLSLQVRFEMIDEEFLGLCKKLNVELEFGLQTIIEEEYKLIERPNNIPKIEQAIKLLKKLDQPFEVSLIYGLPNQTYNSFRKSIQFLLDRCDCVIKAFPLMLLEGTGLIEQKDKYGLKEGIIDNSNIPHVVASNSFTRSEWEKMDRLAKSLNTTREAA
ncbi:hypothetical protein GZ77_05160 [Endozoicomonas montiporae]|uniref:Radical SAM core domain-containing protein n=2 Tax=Endozoicomonas montiporae TaxID=1027273 RepID=A0A081NBS7_9GAMM|nr:radical SAM protein [Endozoicomonas montiporae]AMO56204.1 SAM domain-containing protein [Endozoicomonas montiporae CL-33]KEQ15900.1 hypothetical protein GZ77_05160 [Endozoicomonas montiporae]